MSKYLLIYTREPIDNVYYDPRLAYSMHLGISEDGKCVRPLNHDSGVLFALATENADGSLNPMSIKNPKVFRNAKGGFGVTAVRIPGDGGEDESSKGSVLFWTTEDLIRYREIGLVRISNETIEKVTGLYCEKCGRYVLYAKDAAGKCFRAVLADPAGCETESIESVSNEVFDEKYAAVTCGAGEIETVDMEGTVPSQMLELTDAEAEYLQKKLLTPVNNGICFPERVEVKSAEELLRMTATATYTDGGRVEKRIAWKTDEIDFDRPGEYKVTGTVVQEHFPFPVAFNRADPDVCYWEGKYYFIATNDADGNHSLYVREADTMEGIIDAEEHLILDSVTHEGIGGLLWAPEFHEINGRLYIFHAATPGEFFWEESHIMELRKGGNPACKEDWSAPRKILKPDGSVLCEAGKTISLDMTCFEWEGSFYVIWSQREFLPKDLGAWLYIAKLNPEKPWMLLTDPVVLSKPDYGWGNNHTFVEEGPFALLRGDRLFITFSAAAVDHSYVVSYLEIPSGKDLLVPSNWRKNNYPILTSRSVKNEFGTGHNAYVTDTYGTIWNTYHARPGVEGVRSSGIRRLFFDVDGCPVLDVTEELDCKEEFRTVQTVVCVK